MTRLAALKIATCVAVVQIGMVAPSLAAPMLVTSVGALAPNDNIDWSQFGPTFTVLNGPQVATTSNGSSVGVSSIGNVFERRDQGNGWAGNFAPGTPLLWDQRVGPDITLTFSVPTFAAGAQIQADNFGAFTAQITLFNGANAIASFMEDGNSTSAGDDSAIFIGARSDQLITSISFSLVGMNDFAIGPVALSNSPTPVGAPAPLAGAGLLSFFGAGGVAMRKRAKRMLSSLLWRPLATA